MRPSRGAIPETICTDGRDTRDQERYKLPEAAQIVERPNQLESTSGFHKQEVGGLKNAMCP